MNIDDFKINIKKYDPLKNVAICYVTVCDLIEIRGFQARYTELKNPPNKAQWIVSPPSVRARLKANKYFWIVNILDRSLWHQLQEKIMNEVKIYINF